VSFFWIEVPSPSYKLIVGNKREIRRLIGRKIWGYMTFVHVEDDYTPYLKNEHGKPPL
jgi:hypothetical protein